MKQLKYTEKGLESMCRIVEEIADQKFEAGIQVGEEKGVNRQIDNTLRACSKHELPLSIMIETTGIDEASVIKRLGELGLPIPKS
jgi:hypothetical protein